MKWSTNCFMPSLRSRDERSWWKTVLLYVILTQSSIVVVVECEEGSVFYLFYVHECQQHSNHLRKSPNRNIYYRPTVHHTTSVKWVHHLKKKLCYFVWNVASSQDKNYWTNNFLSIYFFFLICPQEDLKNLHDSGNKPCTTD